MDLPEPFLIFSISTCSTRQSATAAAAMKTSAGNAAATAACISRANSTWTTVAPGGSGNETGPVTSVTFAPAPTAACAIACPWRPDDRLPMNRTGSIAS